MYKIHKEQYEIESVDKTRVDYIDIAKGIGIIGTVSAHFSGGS